MVHKLRCLTTRIRHHGSRVAGKVTLVLLANLCLAVRGWAQEPAVHYWDQWRNATGSDWKPAAPAGRTIGGFFPASRDQGPARGLDLAGCGKSIRPAAGRPRAASGC